MAQLIITTPQELEHMLAQIIKRYLNQDFLQPPKTDKQILSIDEASKYLGIPKATLYGYTSRREIPFQKVGRAIKFNREALNEWLQEKKCKTKSEIENGN